MNTTQEQMRVVVVFGGDGYVGSAAASLFEESGWIALRASRHSVSDTKHITCDITDSASLVEALRATLSMYGRIDACVHAASPALERVPFATTSPASFATHLQTAIVGTMNIAQQGAAVGVHNIVVITSQAMDAAQSKMGAYPFAKRIQHELCALLASALPAQTRIHTIAPGFLPGGLNTDLPQSVRESFAIRENGDRADVGAIARIILGICEQKPEYMTSGSIDGDTRELTPF